MGWLVFWVELVIIVVVLLLALYWRKKVRKNDGFSDLVANLPGPEVHPLIGNAWTVWGQKGGRLR